MNLLEQLKACTGGETIALPAGDYGDVSLRGFAFADPVHITSADPAHPASFASLVILQCEGLALDGVAVDFVPDAKTLHHIAAVRCVSAKRIEITNCPITGGPAVNGVAPEADKLDSTMNVLGRPAGRGIYLDTCSDVLIMGNAISQFHKGIVLSRVTDTIVRRNKVSHLRTTPLSGSGLRNIIVDGNHFHDSDPWNFGGAGDHGDLVHFWTLPGYDEAPVPGLVITNNRFEQGDGYPMLGIYLDDNLNGIGFADVLISNNVIANDNHQAIRLEKVSGAISRNSLTSAGDRPPMIILRNGCDVELDGNIFDQVDADDTSVARGDLSGEGVGADLGELVEPVPVEPAPEPKVPAIDLAELKDRLLKARTEVNDVQDGASRALYAIDKAMEAMGGEGAP